MASDLRAELANCPIRGVELTEVKGENGAISKVRNLVRLKVGQVEFELHQRPGMTSNFGRLKGGCCETTDVFVRQVEEADVPKILETLSLVAELLSFATESRVLPYSHEYPAGSGLFARHSMVGTVQWFRPPFDEPEHIKLFVESCFANYVQLRTRRKLNVAIDYIHHSIMRGLAIEVQAGVACLAFENLRDNFARDEGYPFVAGFFQKKGCLIKDFKKRVHFEDHLIEMFQKVGQTSDASRIVRIRNEVIHTGLMERNPNQKDDDLDFLESTLREYFLRTVGYHGPFFAYSGGSFAPTII